MPCNHIRAAGGGGGGRGVKAHKPDKGQEKSARQLGRLLHVTALSVIKVGRQGLGNVCELCIALIFLNLCTAEGAHGCASRKGQQILRYVVPQNGCQQRQLASHGSGWRRLAIKPKSLRQKGFWTQTLPTEPMHYLMCTPSVVHRGMGMRHSQKGMG